MGNKWTSLHDNRDTQETSVSIEPGSWGGGGVGGLDQHDGVVPIGRKWFFGKSSGSRNVTRGQKSISVSLSLRLETGEPIDKHSEQ